MPATLLTVILNWRTAAMTLQSVETALQGMAGMRGAITVVDNDSGDGSFEAMQAEVTARGWDHTAVPVRVIQSGCNGGFGAGNNVGIRAGLPDGTRPDYVYILNSDAFPDQDAIPALLAHLEAHPATGFAGSFTRGDDGVPQDIKVLCEIPSGLGFGEAATQAVAETIYPSGKAGDYGRVTRFQVK